jgi:integrase
MPLAKTSFRSSGAQAQHAARSLDLKSQGSERNYQQALTGVAQFIKEERLGDLRGLSKETAERYLEMRSQEVGQKTLDLDRQAMQAVLGEKLAVVKSEQKQALESRAYTSQQAQMVASAQSEKHSLATQIAENAGLRAHELLSLRPVNERPADIHREYRDDRFSGRGNIAIYTVEGKGGLCREVALDKALADKLESRRLDEPKTVYDRDIGYRTQYDVGSGKQWSDSFSKASNREFGWSNGAHGLRHEFAQERMNTLQGAGYEYREALEIVSQEMGHFRPEITEVYLR